MQLPLGPSKKSMKNATRFSGSNSMLRIFWYDLLRLSLRWTAAVAFLGWTRCYWCHSQVYHSNRYGGVPARQLWAIDGYRFPMFSLLTLFILSRTSPHQPARAVHSFKWHDLHGCQAERGSLFAQPRDQRGLPPGGFAGKFLRSSLGVQPTSPGCTRCEVGPVPFLRRNVHQLLQKLTVFLV